LTRASIIYASERHGAGFRLKVINQLTHGEHLAVASEALALAKRQGFPPDITMDVLQNGAGSSWMLCNRGLRYGTTPYGSEISFHAEVSQK
jgi:3-hydroxyisobutyrate dehydrogenase